MMDSGNHPCSLYEASVNLPVAIKDVAEIVQETLNSLFYLGASINSRYGIATAFQMEREQEGFDHWDFRYEANIEWQMESPSIVRVTVRVCERTQVNCDYECEQRVNHLISLLSRFAQRTQNQLPPATTYGSARWASSSELEEAGYLKPLTTADSGRLICGLGLNDEIISVTERETYEHALICGPTGSGKSTGIFIPNIVRRLGTSALVTEVAAGQRKPEILYSRTAGWRAKNGQKIFYFNPAKLGSARINPLDAIKSDDPELEDPDHSLFYDSASYVANLLMANTKELSPIEDKIWSQSEQHLITALMLYAVGLRKDINRPSQEGDGANLANLRALLREGPTAIDRHVSRSKVKLAAVEYSAFLKTTSPNFRLGVISGVMSRLNPWVNPKISTLTEVTDFDPLALRDELFTFYFSTLITRPQYKPVAALALNYVIEMLLDYQYKHPVTLLLDEFTNYGYVPDIERKLQTIRNQDIGMVIGIQHADQVKKLYKDDASAILGQPSTRIFFRPRDNASARLISLQLGPSTVETREPNGRHTHRAERAKLLLDESELMRLDKGQIVLFTGSANPVLAHAFPPDAHDAYTCFPAPELPQRNISQSALDLCSRGCVKPSWEREAKSQITNFKKTVSQKSSRRPGAKSRFSNETFKKSRFEH